MHMWIIATFGNKPNWKPALRRMKSQFGKLPDGYKGIVYDQENLKKELISLNQWDFVNNNHRGFGYWIWKPILILELFKQFPQCTGVIYLDAGCELNINQNSMKRLGQYQDLAMQQGVLSFELNALEIDFTSPYTANKMEMVIDSSWRQSMATTFIVTNTEFGKQFLTTWFELMLSDGYRLLKGEDDVFVSTHCTTPYFYKEHRHDQSIFSLLIKKNGLISIREESEWYPNWSTKGANFPIWAARNRLRISIKCKRITNLSYRLLRKLINLITIGKIKI